MELKIWENSFSHFHCEEDSDEITYRKQGLALHFRSRDDQEDPPVY